MKPKIMIAVLLMIGSCFTTVATPLNVKEPPHFFDPADPKCYRIITNGKEWRIQRSGYLHSDLSNWIWLNLRTGLKNKKEAQDVLAKVIKEAKELEADSKIVWMVDE